MALEAGIVGLPNAGKTTLFNALTNAGAEITAYASQSQKTNVGMAPIADERLDQLAAIVEARKVTPAAVRIVDVPGTGAALLGNLRSVDALLAVVDGFSPGATPEDDLVTLELELLVADRDHVEKRLERIEKQSRVGDMVARAELAQLEPIVAHLDAERPLREYDGPIPEALEPLTTKPIIAVVNGPGGIDLKLEAELAELSEEEAAEFREGGGPSALAQIVTRIFSALDLIQFFTAGEKETRSWTLGNGETALDAAASIHTDIAKGFIRCEVMRAADLIELGSRAEVAKQGKERLEGKTYVIQDGDVLNIRFSPPSR